MSPTVGSARVPGLLATATRDARYWNVHPSERLRPFTCDRVLDSPVERAVRGIDVAAPAALVFRWVEQLKVAPYSYDVIDNLGRRSPRTLTPGVAVRVGDHVMIGDVVDLTPGVELTVVTSGRGRVLFGEVALTYEVVPSGAAASRLLCCLALGGSTSAAARPLRWALMHGDAIMMRKQFLVLKECAEHDAP